MPRGSYPRRVKRHAVQPLGKPYRYIALTQGQVAIVDAKDFDRLSRFNWYACWDPRMKSFYARRKVHRRQSGMHREIARAKPSEEVDHWNHNTLDNRRKNLRKCSHAQNTRNHDVRKVANFSGYKGVTWGAGTWRVRLRCGNRLIDGGRFSSKKKAAKAYDSLAKRYHRKFASFNFN